MILPKGGAESLGSCRECRIDHAGPAWSRQAAHARNAPQGQRRENTGVVLVQSHNGNQSEAPSPTPAARSSRWANAALLLISFLGTLLTIEIGYRLVAGLPVLKLAN